MAKEGNEEHGTKETPSNPQEVMKNTILYALRSGCMQEGGLQLPLRWRGVRQVSETLTFFADTNIDVKVNSANFDVTLIINDTRYHTVNVEGTSQLIQAANSFVQSEGATPFRFPDHLSFRAVADFPTKEKDAA